MHYDELNKILPMSRDVTPLSAPLAAGGKIFPNRLAIQAMEGADGTADGTPDELTVRRYERFAKGGAGLLWFEATAVCREARANPHQLWLHKKNADAYKRLVEKMKADAFAANGITPVIILQATHSGRYAKPDGKFSPMIAWYNPILEGDTPLPSECIVTDDYLRRVEDYYADCARLAADCGFDGLDIKACHRYLNNELLSAVNRPGAYGGSLENRMRFFKNCADNMRASAPAGFLVTSRMNIYDGIPYPYGFGVNAHNGLAPDLSEPIAVIKAMGFTFLNITMGNPYYNPQVNRPVELEGVERMYRLTRRVKEACPGLAVVSSAPTYLREQSPYLAAGAVAQGFADIVGYGRMAFAYPGFARDTLEDHFDRTQSCITCGKCSELMRGAQAGCAVRDPLYTALYKEMTGRARA